MVMRARYSPWARIPRERKRRAKIVTPYREIATVAIWSLNFPLRFLILASWVERNFESVRREKS